MIKGEIAKMSKYYFYPSDVLCHLQQTSKISLLFGYVLTHSYLLQFTATI